MKKDYPEIRYILGPARNGTSSFQRALCQGEGLKGIYEPLRFEQRWPGGASRRVLRSLQDKDCHHLFKKEPDKVFILKDVLGFAIIRDAAQIFTDEIVKRTRPVFIFRDPFLSSQSHKKMGWYSVKEYGGYYKKAFELYQELADRKLPVAAVTHEQSIKQAEKVLSEIHNFWAIGNKAGKCDAQWNKDYFDTVFYEDVQKDEIFSDDTHKSLLSSKGLKEEFTKQADPKYCLTPKEERFVRTNLLPLYEQIKQNSIVAKPKP